MRLIRVAAAGLAAVLALVALGTVGLADWPTYHRDAARTGVDPTEPTPPFLNGAWTTGTLDAGVYAEPVVSGGVVVVATENDSVYGFSAATGQLLWRVSLGTPVPRSMLPCGNIDPLGITGTPVVSGGDVYVVAERRSATGGVEHVLAQIPLAAPSSLRIVGADPPGMNPTVQQERGALTVVGGLVVIPYGGLWGDCGGYHGYVVATPTTMTGALSYWYDTQTGREGGIWATAGPSVDAAGHLYVATGNGSVTGSSMPCPSASYDTSDAVVELDPTTLAPSHAPLSFFAPSQWCIDNLNDVDLGSVSPELLQAGQVFQVGKSGIGYLLNQGSLGGIGGARASHQVCHATQDAAFGGMAYNPPVVYVPCSDGIAAVVIDSPTAFHVAWYATQASGPPIVASGLVWSLDQGSGVLHAIDPATGADATQLAVGTVTPHFVTPASDGGRLFIAATNRLEAWTLGPPGGTGPLRLTVRGADGAAWALAGSDATPAFGGGYAPLGGAVVGPPAVVSVPPAGGGTGTPGTPYYIATGSDGNLWVRSEPAGWRPMAPAGTRCTSGPGAVAVHDGGAILLAVACRGGDGAVWYAQADVGADPAVPPSVGPLRSLGGIITETPALTAVLPAASTSQAITVLGTGGDGHIWTRTVAGPWTSTPWICRGRPAAAAVQQAGGTLTAFACQGGDGAAWMALNRGHGWGGAVSLGGRLVGGPGIALTPGRMTVVVAGADLAVWQTSAAAGSTAFGGWTSAGGRVTAGPVAAALLAAPDNP